jgi:metal-sulfur cluster biosynthetic enzyme
MTSADGSEPARAALIAALQDGVIDPDLGVNVVDLGFVRQAGLEEGIASLVMTLTSPACPLTKVIEAQARTAVVGPLARELKIEWIWTPTWSPADITPEGREQLNAIGFSFGAPPRQLAGSRCPARPTWSGNSRQLVHERCEVIEGQALLGIGQRLIRRRVDLDEQAMSSCRTRGPCHRRDVPALSGAMAGVDDDRQVRSLPDDGDSGQIEGVTGGPLERPDATLAEDHLLIALRDDVLGRREPLLDRAGQAALEQHRTI